MSTCNSTLGCDVFHLQLWKSGSGAETTPSTGAPYVFKELMKM